MNDKLHHLFDQLQAAVDTVHQAEDQRNQIYNLVDAVESTLIGAADALHNDEHGIVESQINQVFDLINQMRDLL